MEEMVEIAQVNVLDRVFGEDIVDALTSINLVVIQDKENDKMLHIFTVE